MVVNSAIAISEGASPTAEAKLFSLKSVRQYHLSIQLRLSFMPRITGDFPSLVRKFTPVFPLMAVRVRGEIAQFTPRFHQRRASLEAWASQHRSLPSRRREGSAHLLSGPEKWGRVSMYKVHIVE